MRPTRLFLLAASVSLGLCACSKSGGDEKGAGGPGGGRGGAAPTIVEGRVTMRDFADRMQAVGTAFANESTTLSSAVTEQVVKINFSDGAYVQKGQVIAELQRGQEAAGLREANARALGAQQRLDRLIALQKQGFATNASVDEQTAILDSARAQAGSVSAQIGDRVIRAPFSGVLGLRRLSPGATVTAGTEIATISDVSSIKLDFALPETFLASMRVGQSIEARAAAYPDELFRGQIEGIDNVVDPLTRAITVRAILPNGDRRLRPGMLLTVDVLSNQRKAPAVPELSLVALREQNFVFKIDAESVAVRVPVEIGVRQDGFVEVKRGVQPGERIVAEGTVKIRDGGKVRPMPPTAQTATTAEGS